MDAQANLLDASELALVHYNCTLPVTRCRARADMYVIAEFLHVFCDALD